MHLEFRSRAEVTCKYLMPHLTGNEILAALRFPGKSLRDVIRENLRTVKIRIVQLDPNGLCNAGCWFCPVKYQGNPTEFVNQLTPGQLEYVVSRLKTSPLTDARFNFLYTAHYNEVLLYRYFEEMLEIFRRHQLKTMILSNGTTLTPAKTDVILRYSDVVTNVHLNVPSFDRADWAAKAGMNPKLFDNLVRNIDYYYERSPGNLTVQVNTASEGGSAGSDGIVTSLSKTEQIRADFKVRYPKLAVSVTEGLIDRAGELGKINVIKGPESTRAPVVGCNHSLDTGNRIFGWAHVNAKGDLFLCCNDYKMDYRFGNILTADSFEELWLSERHVEVIEQAYAGICRDCSFRVTL